MVTSLADCSLTEATAGPQVENRRCGSVCTLTPGGIHLNQRSCILARHRRAAPSHCTQCLRNGSTLVTGPNNALRVMEESARAWVR